MQVVKFFTLETTLHIKYVVCARCKMTLQNILQRLEIPYDKVSLGEVVLEKPLTKKQHTLLQTELLKVGFELLEDKNERIVNRIKSIIISDIYEGEGSGNQNLSVILSKQLHFDYSHLSNLFTAIEGKSINTFQQNIKIERIKELLEYDELSIGQIADDLGFGNAAYLSTAFKKHTGITPSQYRRLHLKNRKAIDSA